MSDSLFPWAAHIPHIDDVAGAHAFSEKVRANDHDAVEAWKEIVAGHESGDVDLTKMYNAVMSANGSPLNVTGNMIHQPNDMGGGWGWNILKSITPFLPEPVASGAKIVSGVVDKVQDSQKKVAAVRVAATNPADPNHAQALKAVDSLKQAEQLKNALEKVGEQHAKELAQVHAFYKAQLAKAPRLLLPASRFSGSGTYGRAFRLNGEHE